MLSISMITNLLDTLPFSFVYGLGLILVILLSFVAYWFSKFPEAVTETINPCTPEESPYDVP